MTFYLRSHFRRVLLFCHSEAEGRGFSSIRHSERWTLSGRKHFLFPIMWLMLLVIWHGGHNAQSLWPFLPCVCLCSLVHCKLQSSSSYGPLFSNRWGVNHSKVTFSWSRIQMTLFWRRSSCKRIDKNNCFSMDARPVSWQCNFSEIKN